MQQYSSKQAGKERIMGYTNAKLLAATISKILHYSQKSEIRYMVAQNHKEVKQSIWAD